MGQDLELNFEKYCVVDGSPKTVLVSPRHSKVEKKKVRRKPKCGNEGILSQNKEFTEISFHRYRSASCRAVSSTRLVAKEAPKRGSVYQSSNEVGKLNKVRERETGGRKKIEFSRSAAPIPFEIVDSLYSSDEENGSLGSLSSTLLEMSFNSVSKENVSTRNEESQFLSTPLQKSLSARLALPHSESDSSRSTSPKTRFSPFRKMFDPFSKSKSQKSPLGYGSEEPDEATSSSSGPVSAKRNITLRKSLLPDFSNTHCNSSRLLKKHSCSSLVSTSSSPAHLSGLLKVANKNGVAYLEFSVKNPNDFLLAKTWKVGNGFNWVYTFHTAQNRRMSNASGRGSKDHTSKEFMMVGQMQVSCYLCTELVNAGAFNNSMLTEFVLYDVARQRKSVSQIPEDSNSKESSSGETCESNEVTDPAKVNVHNNMSASNPWPVADLHPELEVAAIVVRFPSEKRESLKYKRGDMRNDDLLNLPFKLEKIEATSDCLSPAKVNVVIPSGNHGLPNSETPGPSPLLDRWRLGGGCDCGGWDMGCPLVVFGNSNIQDEETCKLPLELFLKGTKDNIPALTMKMAQEGRYEVDFHARLSSLQAFSICVAILHSSEASTAAGHERNRQMWQSDSLRVFIEDEVKHLIEAVAEEEKRQPSKNIQEIPPTFVVNPPFSPMSRA